MLNKHSKTSFEKNCFSAWASTLNMGLINKVDMVCLSPVGYGVLKERLLRESSELTLERAASLCRAAEESKRQLKHLGKNPEKKEVHPVRKGGKPPTAKAKAGGESPFNCSKCGTRHLPKHCAAFQKMCHLCKRKGHFFKCCPLRQINSRGVHEVTECAASTGESEDSPGPIDFFIGTITGGEINSA